MCHLEIKEKSITRVAFQMCVALTHNYTSFVIYHSLQ